MKRGVGCPESDSRPEWLDRRPIPGLFEEAPAEVKSKKAKGMKESKRRIKMKTRHIFFYFLLFTFDFLLGRVRLSPGPAWLAGGMGENRGGG